MIEKPAIRSIVDSEGTAWVQTQAQAADIERLCKDAARYRYLRDTFFQREGPPSDDFTGDIIICPPRTETFKRGISIMTNAAHGEHLDAVIDAALSAPTPGDSHG